MLSSKVEFINLLHNFLVEFCLTFYSKPKNICYLYPWAYNPWLCPCSSVYNSWGLDHRCYPETRITIHEPPHDKTNKMACAPSEDSDQPGHPPSLIRVFAVRMKKPWVLSYPVSAERRLIRLGRCPGWSESSLGAHSFCWFCHVVAHM